MKLLAIDSSGLVATVAVITEEALLAEYTLNYRKTHSQTLLPMLQEIIRLLEFDLSELDAIAVAAGPGSFTGLRIGSATAKGLGLALDKPIIPVPTVDALAYNLYGVDKLICPMMDAKRNQVYTGLYEFASEDLHVLKEQTAIPVEEMIDEINQRGREVIYLGDGAKAYQEVISKRTTVGFQFAPLHLNRQRAGALGALGVKYFLDHKYEAAAQHEPVYLRLSQAERERAERLMKN
ncbi:MAG: peptidase glycoprotease [Herbinix sp.]|jgi:tRNA threonylcarbamoyladenosine biosynthesis protein TsaB|nr:peptidase glycoprotease [Herbinix sp.]